MSGLCFSDVYPPRADLFIERNRTLFKSTPPRPGGDVLPASQSPETSFQQKRRNATSRQRSVAATPAVANQPVSFGARANNPARTAPGPDRRLSTKRPVSPNREEGHSPARCRPAHGLRAGVVAIAILTHAVFDEQ